MEKQHTKPKKILYIVVFIVAIVVAFFAGYKYCESKVIINTPEDLELKVFEEYEIPNASGTFFDSDISKDIVMNNDINIEKLGEYTVNYSYKLFNMFDITKEIKAKVIDTEPPVIRFDGGYVFYIPTSGNYTLPKATSIDEYDGECEGEYIDTVNTKQEGLQTISYKSCDLSNNCNYSALNVYVTDELNNEMFEKDVYKTTDYFTSAHEHQDFGDDNLYEYYFVGDSNIGMLQFNGYLPPEIVCAKACLSPNNIKLNITYAGIERDYNLFVLLETLQSKNILINIGQCQIDYSTIDEFIKQYSETLFVIKNNSAYPQIVVSEILPVLNDDVPNKPTNKEINIFNYHLAELCKNMGIKMITPGEVLKDENGNGVARYYTEDGYHLSREGEEVYLDYLKTHLPYPY